MKIILLCVIVAMFTYIGISIKNNFKKREKLLEEILIFLKKMQSEIGFLQTNLSKIIENSKVIASSNFKTILEVFEIYLKNGNVEQIKQSLEKSILKEDEKEQLLNLFLNLGRGEAESEVNKLKNYVQFFELKVKKVGDENSKYCPLAVKLSILISLAICILLA